MLLNRMLQIIILFSTKYILIYTWLQINAFFLNENSAHIASQVYDPPRPLFIFVCNSSE
jgi:hypothetical protein